jgi:hypothetical protein
MDGSDTRDKASWTKAMLHTFVTLALKLLRHETKHPFRQSWLKIYHTIIQRANRTFINKSST